MKWKPPCRNFIIARNFAFANNKRELFSELELRIIRQRVKSGMANAKAKGAQIERPTLRADDIPPIFYRHYSGCKAGQLNISELAKVCQLSRSTVYKYIEYAK